MRTAFNTLLVVVGTTALAAQTNDKAPQAKPVAGAVAVFATCNNGNGPCTAQASCPAGKPLTTGTAFYLVPDGIGAAFGICGTGRRHVRRDPTAA